METILDFIELIETHKKENMKIERVHLRYDIIQKIIKNLEKTKDAIIPTSNTLAGYNIVVCDMNGPEYAIVFKDEPTETI